MPHAAPGGDSVATAAAGQWTLESQVAEVSSRAHDDDETDARLDTVVEAKRARSAVTTLLLIRIRVEMDLLWRTAAQCRYKGWS